MISRERIEDLRAIRRSVLNSSAAKVLDDLLAARDEAEELLAEAAIFIRAYAEDECNCSGLEGSNHAVWCEFVAGRLREKLAVFLRGSRYEVK